MGFIRQLFNNKKPSADVLFNQNNSSSVLERLAQARVPLSIQVANYQHKLYNSYLLKLDQESGRARLIIDELMPRQANELTKPGETLSVKCNHRGVEFKFKTKVLEIEKELESILYLTSVPGEIIQSQPRNAYRVAVKKFTRIPVSFACHGRGVLKGTLSDLSNTGVGITIPKAIKPGLHDNELIDSCYINLDNGTSIEFSMQIKHVVYSNLDRSTYIGGRFTSFKRNNEKLMEKLVAQLQREERRRSIDTF